MNTLPMLPFRLGYLKFQVAFFYPTYISCCFFFGRVGCVPQARTPLPVMPSCPCYSSRVRAFRTYPTPYKWAGYLKFIFQVAFCVSVGFGKMADV